MKPLRKRSFSLGFDARMIGAIELLLGQLSEGMIIVKDIYRADGNICLLTAAMVVFCHETEER
jgi:hypothetical protein